MKITKAEHDKIVGKIPKELVLIRVEAEEQETYNIIVGDNLSGVFDLVEELDTAHEEEEWVAGEPDSGQEVVEDIISDILSMTDIKSDYVISARETIAYLDLDDIKLTQKGVDEYLKNEGWNKRVKGKHVIIERVKPVFE